MSTDYGEKERQFLESLEADTGLSLAAWMEAIAAQGLTERNDIIDWLRRQGFMFSKASWLERIHHNGGRPLYGERGGARRERRPRVARQPPALTAAPVSATIVPFPAPAPRPESVPAPPADASDKAQIDELVAKAKAFRPLANFVLAEIVKAVPGASLKAHAAHVSIARGVEFAVLAISPRELRLGLDLGGRVFDKTVQAAKFTNSVAPISPGITHMIILTDARQVDDSLRALVREAADHAG